MDSTFALRLVAIHPTRPAPRLTIRNIGSQVTVSWNPEEGALETTDSLDGPWQPVLEAHPPGNYTTPVAEAKRFYRVVVP
jgi:hypothetical protein